MAKPEPADHDSVGPSSGGSHELPTVPADGARLAQALPERIGRYHVERVIASGGMGTVYEPTQENPRRVVAVKVMKQGVEAVESHATN